jgi:2'-5' RNA ligase
MRTFIAIDLNTALKKSLEDLIARLRPLGRNVRWVGAAGMHLTLKFLGEIPEQNLSRVESALGDVVKRHRPFTLSLEGTGFFPPGARAPRVLWVGLREVPLLMTLQEDLERAMERLGFAREKREFHPHLTLGRVKIPSDLQPLLLELDKFRKSSFGEMKVERVSFFRSTLKPSGAEYSVLAEFPLE